MNPNIFIRVFIETPEIKVGEQAAISITDRLQPFADLSQSQIKQYWKIPEYIEISLEFIPKIELNEIFQVTVAQLGEGWDFSSSSKEKWAVWNPAETKTFSIPEVRWASVEIIS